MFRNADRGSVFAVLAIEDGIEVWVVVHLQRGVVSVSFSSRKNIAQELLQSQAKISMLGAADGNFFLHASKMCGIDIVAEQLFLKVVFAEGENAEAIDRAAGCFGIQCCVHRRLDLECVKSMGDPRVDLFDPVVSQLVVAIDGPFDIGDFGIRGGGASREIFFVPEKKVVSVLLADNLPDSGADRCWITHMPTGNEFPLEIRDFLDPQRFCEVVDHARNCHLQAHKHVVIGSCCWGEFTPNHSLISDF